MKFYLGCVFLFGFFTAFIVNAILGAYRYVDEDEQPFD